MKLLEFHDIGKSRLSLPLSLEPTINKEIGDNYRTNELSRIPGE